VLRSFELSRAGPSGPSTSFGGGPPLDRATPHPVCRFVPLLIAGDLQGLLDLFGDVPRVNDPRLGWVEGAFFAPFVQASHEGLSERHARVEHRAITTSAQGAVEECSLSLVRQGVEVRVPVAIAAPGSNGTLDSVRVYHSMLPLMGAHGLRPPILSAIPELPLPEVVARYHDHLARGDVSGVVQQFEPRGSLREALGEESVHRGTRALRGFFDQQLSRGGISAEGCSVTDDGRSCAFEYNITAWGSGRLPQQAGITIYERATSGLLSAVRIYDDVAPPVGPEAGPPASIVF
jgi:hypothetical protein